MNRLPPAFKTTELGPLPEEWEVVRLGEVAEFIMGQSPSSKTYNLDRVGLPFLQGKAEFGDVYPQPVKWCSKPLKVSPEGAILLSVRAPVGDVNLAPYRCCIGRGLAAIQPEISNADTGFLFYWLRFSKVRFEEQSSGSTFKSINKGVLERFLTPLPPLPEQQAAARVLRTVQQAKEATEKVIAATRELKKSLMRHLFTYGPVPVEEAESVPLKETEVGPVPEHWEVVRLGEVVALTQYGISQRGQANGEYPILRMNNLSGGRVVFDSRQYVDLDEKTLMKFRLREGDLLFNRTNSYELVGKIALFDLPGNYVFASYLVRIVTDSRKLLPECINYYLNATPTQARLKLLASRGVSQSNISATKLKGFSIPLPPLPEQQEIARILSAVDGKIATEGNRKRTLEALFKALLHHLMTGKLRVEVEAGGQ